jgi:glyoxylate/hydroxypyruvate reductase A
MLRLAASAARRRPAAPPAAAAAAAPRRAVMAAASATPPPPPPPPCVAAFPESEVIVATSEASRGAWAAALRAAGLRVRVADYAAPPPTAAELEKVEFAVVWDPPRGLLAACPRLRAVQSMGAGVDAVLALGDAIPDLPLLRIVDPLMAQRMATWVLWAVVNSQRRADAYLEAQRAARWDKGVEAFTPVDNGALRVGVMGLGAMGGAAADALAALGYRVSAWTRTARPPRPGVARAFHGAAQLGAFAAALDVAVCLLPLTPETRGVLNARFFASMPPGGVVVNAARGGHLVEADLLAALDAGHLRGAVLDVADPEPPPADSRLWRHPAVRLFPHVASMTNVETAVQQIVASRECVLRGEVPPGAALVDRRRGY